MRIRLRRVVTGGLGLAAAAVAGAALFVVAGWYNVSATARHLPPVVWVLDTALRESVQRHARSIDPPDLSDPALAARAAGDFATACAPCHGAPGVPKDPMGRGLYPEPPPLSEAVSKWRREELFWITRHGIKMTGMPAWGPSHRDDEIWALVAFLLRLPDMSPPEYRRVTDAALDRPADVAPPVGEGAAIARRGLPFQGLAACARCHGLDGAGLPAGGIPRLSGQDPDYLAGALDSYAVGLRRSGVMGPVARALTPGQRRAAAAYYGAIEAAPAPPPPTVDEATLALGTTLAMSGAPERNIPACGSCHGGPGTASDPGVPAIAGQFAGYMRLQFHLWRQGERGAGPDGAIMQRIALLLSDREIAAVALYYAALRDDTGELALE